MNSKIIKIAFGILNEKSAVIQKIFIVIFIFLFFTYYSKWMINFYTIIFYRWSLDIIKKSLYQQNFFNSIFNGFKELLKNCKCTQIPMACSYFIISDVFYMVSANSILEVIGDGKRSFIKFPARILIRTWKFTTVLIYLLIKLINLIYVNVIGN